MWKIQVKVLLDGVCHVGIGVSKQTPGSNDPEPKDKRPYGKCSPLRHHVRLTETGIIEHTIIDHLCNHKGQHDQYEFHVEIDVGQRFGGICNQQQSAGNELYPETRPETGE